MLKIKDWLKRRQQFEIIYSNNGNTIVKRLKDEKMFERFKYFQRGEDIVDICGFNKNMIHVDIRVYTSELIFKKMFIMPINDL